MALAAALLLPAPAALAQEQPSAAAQPDPSQPPPRLDISRYYPPRAQRLGIEGRAVISCTVTAAGLLTGCTVIEETPMDYGFGEAALRMSRLFRMRPKTADGAPVEGGTVRIPLAFKLPPNPPAAPPQAPSPQPEPPPAP